MRHLHRREPSSVGIECANSQLRGALSEGKCFIIKCAGWRPTHRLKFSPTPDFSLWGDPWGLPPAKAIAYRSVLPARSLVNKIHLPSGDQPTILSSLGSAATLISLAPSRLSTNKSFCLLLSLCAWLYPRYLPSGEK